MHNAKDSKHLWTKTIKTSKKWKFIHNNELACYESM